MIKQISSFRLMVGAHHPRPDNVILQWWTLIPTSPITFTSLLLQIDNACDARKSDSLKYSCAIDNLLWQTEMTPTRQNASEVELGFYAPHSAQVKLDASPQRILAYSAGLARRYFSLQAFGYLLGSRTSTRCPLAGAKSYCLFTEA